MAWTSREYRAYLSLGIDNRHSVEYLYSTMANRTIVSIEITSAEVTPELSERLLGKYSCVDGLNRAFRSIHASQAHSAYCKTDVTFTWSDGKTAAFKFCIFGTGKLTYEPTFEAEMGQRIRSARTAETAGKNSCRIIRYGSREDAQEHLLELRELFTAVCEFDRLVISGALEDDADAIIAALRAELATSKSEADQLERDNAGLVAEFDGMQKQIAAFEVGRQQMETMRETINTLLGDR